MTRIVADASFCGAWILPDEASKRAEQVLEGLAAGSLELCVPSLWFYEMLNVLRSAVRQGRLSEALISEALSLLRDVPVTMRDIPGELSQQRLMQFALRFNLSAYDASYLELADRLQAPLHTEDKAMRKAAAKLSLLPGSRP